MAEYGKTANDGQKSPVVMYWSSQIESAKKREKDYRKEGQRLRKIYDGSRKNTHPFNILYSNTETLSPALYSSTPKPVVQRRYKDSDPLGKAASMAGQRALEFMIDPNISDDESFDQCMSDAVLDALLPGRGVTRVRYEAELTKVPQEGVDEAGSPLPEVEQKTYEIVTPDAVSWDRVYFGFARKWSRVPWIAFEHHMDKQEATEKFGAEVANRMIFTTGDDRKKEEWDGAEKDDKNSDNSERKTCLVYEIWKKAKKTVCFISPTFPGGYLKEEADPLELTGFYPMPKPMMFLHKTDDLNPSALYLLYENQATELNRITTRINRCVEAIKVRGAYDASLGDTLSDLLKKDDNSMIAAGTASNIRLEGGLDKYIWFMPLDQLIGVLKQLIIARQECKQVIYEVTGIADILRGATDANETLGAQQIKNQWASMRIKMMQNEVRRYVRDVLRMMLELAAKKFSPETFAQMTGLPYITAEDKARAQQIAEAMKAQGQEIPPDVANTLQTPDWNQVLDLLKNDTARAFRLDIETASTIEVNEMEDKQNITEAMTAMGQFINGVTPLVKEGVMPFEAAQSMLLSIVRRFRFGTEVEEQIKSMTPPQKQGDPAADAEKAKAQADLAIGQQKAQAETEKLQMEMQAAREEHAARMAELAAKREYEQMMAQIRLAEARARMAEMALTPPTVEETPV